MKIAILVLAILGVVAASVVKRQVPVGLPPLVDPPLPQARQVQPIAHTYHLPSGAELLVGNIKSTFSCIDKIYGYYADLDNNCQIFHVCVPFVDEENNQAPIVYNFVCGNLTVFDQANLVCSHPDNATPCSEAPTYYSKNEEFGRTDRPIVRE